MSDTVTFSSGVLVGQRGSGAMTTDWFNPSTSEEFAAFTLQLADWQPLVGIRGMPARNKPVLLRFAGGGLSDVEGKLHAIEAYPLLNGAPRMTMSGSLDAVAGSGHIAKMTMDLHGDAASREMWGILADLQVSVEGGQMAWTATAVFYPCCVLAYTTSAALEAVDGCVPSGGVPM